MATRFLLRPNALLRAPRAFSAAHQQLPGPRGGGIVRIFSCKDEKGSAKKALFSYIKPLFYNSHSAFSTLSIRTPKHAPTPTNTVLFAQRSKHTISANKMSHFTVSVPGTSASSHSSVTTLSSSSSSRELGQRQFSTEPKKEGEPDLESAKPEEKQEKKPGKFKVLMQQYGRVAIVAYLAVTAVDLLICIWGVWLGGDTLVYKINSYLGQYIPRLQKAAQKMEEGDGSGADKWVTIFIVGYAVHKCLTPLRLAITAAILPWSARTAQRLGLTWIIPKSAPKVTAKPFAEAAKKINRKLK